MECWATYKHTYLTLIDWGEILALKLWSQNLTPVKILKTCLPITYLTPLLATVCWSRGRVMEEDVQRKKAHENTL